MDIKRERGSMQEPMISMLKMAEYMMIKSIFYCLAHADDIDEEWERWQEDGIYNYFMQINGTYAIEATKIIYEHLDWDYDKIDAYIHQAAHHAMILYSETSMLKEMR